ncbi:MAG TPA: mechanosensitive ion channel family protein, partial [Pyrinomonadaceae bacterium]|nr:mechanosensitive ion channel family protein [Pyrinomonadaceae bacterium]
DHLTIGANQGKVEAIGIRATSLRKDDGELILIPNADMYSSALTIRGAGDRRRLNFSITVSFDADVELTKKEIEAAVNGTDGVLDNPAPKVFISTFSAEGIEFTAKFWIDSKVSSPIEVLDIAAAESAKRLKKQVLDHLRRETDCSLLASS